MKYHAINPFAASIFPITVFLVAFFFPGDTWRTVLYENDFIQYSWPVLLFVTVCNIFLYVGISIGARLWGRASQPSSLSASSTYLRVMPVIVFTVFVLVIFIYYLATNYPGYLLLTVSGQANIAKQMLIDKEIKYTTLIHYAIPVVLWAFYRRLETSGIRRLPFLSIFTNLGIALVLVIAFVNAARYLILPIVLGLYVMYAKLKKYDRISFDKHLGVSIRSYGLLVFSVLLIFSLFSFLRGSDDVSEIYSSILGYGPVSYNRLALQLQEKLAFDYSGTGAYVVPDPFLSFFRTVAGFSPLNGDQIWNSEFTSVGKVGLNADFIWLTVYGYTFDSIGYFSPFYFLIFGIFSGAAWRSFLRGGVFGIVFYPFVFFSIFFFFGSNYLATYFQYYLIIFILLSCYEKAVSLIADQRSSGLSRVPGTLPSKPSAE